MKVKLYKYLSDNFELIECEEGKTLKESLPEVKDWKKRKVFVNGKIENENYVVDYADNIFIRSIPYESFSAADWFYTVITGGIYAVVKAGKDAYEANKEAQRAAKELEKLKRNTKDDVLNLPYLKGANNSIATGQSQPYIMGTHLFTPYILNASKSGSASNGFHEISGANGSKQFLNRVYEIGFAKQIPQKITIGNIELIDFKKNVVFDGTFNFDNKAYTSDESYCEIAQQKEFTHSFFNKKIVESEKSDNLKLSDSDDYKDLIYTLEPNSRSADICIMFNGLMMYNEDGTEGNRTRNIVPSYSYNYAELAKSGRESEATWVNFNFNNNGTYTNTFSGKFKTQIRYNAHIEFSFSDIFETKTDSEGKTYYEDKYLQPITIKLSTPDKKLSKGQDVSDCYVQWIHSYIFDKTKTKNSGSFVDEKIIENEALLQSCLMGIHLEANTANEGLTDSLQVITSGVARVFEKDENGNYYLTTERVKTSNPSSWWVEVLTSDCHRPSKYEDSEIDLQAFGEWFDYCEEKEFTINYVITQGKTKSAMLDMIRECGRASTYTNIYGQISVAFDDEIENASGLLNEQNLISFSYEKDMSRKIDGLSIKYIDSENGYQENNIVVMYDGSVNPETRNADTILKSINLEGVTTWKNAYRYALYTMKCEKLRPKKCVATVGEEGFFFTPFSKFLIQHPSLKIGLGNSEIKDIIYNQNESKIIGLELYDYIELDEDNNFNVVIQCVSDYYCSPISRAIKGYDGRTKEIEFKTPIETSVFVQPHKNDILSYGYDVETVTDEMIISNVEKSNKGYKITLYDYDERIFEDVSTFPDYEPNLTEPKNKSGTLPSSLPSPTIAEVNQTIEKAVEKIDTSIIESPNIYAELNSCGFSVNDEGVTPISQSIKTKVHVIQENKEIDFYFGEFNLPSGFHVDIDYHTVKISVDSGVRISVGNITIPVIFRKLIHDNFYGDEEGILYKDENGEIYGEFNYDTELTYYNLGFSYSGIKGGKQIGPYKNVSEIPTENIVIGDYFVFSGVSSGSFEQCAVYAWNGLKWIKDETKVHCMSAMSDILSVANADLEKNNSTAYEYMEHLTANSIFVDKLVANSAYINKLTANEAFINSLNTKFLKSEDLTADRIKGISGVFDSITSNNGKFTNANVSGRIEANDGFFYGTIGFPNPLENNIFSGKEGILFIFVNINCQLGVFSYNEKLPVGLFISYISNVHYVAGKASYTYELKEVFKDSSLVLSRKTVTDVFSIVNTYEFSFPNALSIEGSLLTLNL